MPTPTHENTVIPKVPIRTPMFDQNGQLTRTWIYFFERRFTGGGGSGTETFFRTLLLKNAAPGNDIADHVVAHTGGTVQLVVGVLRKVITSDLTVRINVVTASGSTTIGTFTIPQATPINTPVEFESFTNSTLSDLDVLSWDVTASDSSSDPAGVASFTIYWQ